MCSSEDSDQPGHLPSLISLRCLHEEAATHKAHSEDTGCTGHFVGFVMPRLIYKMGQLTRKGSYLRVDSDPSNQHAQPSSGANSLWPSSSSLYCVSKQRRLWRDCADAQAHQSLRCLHMWLVPFSHEPAH